MTFPFLNKSIETFGSFSFRIAPGNCSGSYSMFGMLIAKLYKSSVAFKLEEATRFTIVYFKRHQPQSFQAFKKAFKNQYKKGFARLKKLFKKPKPGGGFVYKVVFVDKVLRFVDKVFAEIIK